MASVVLCDYSNTRITIRLMAYLEDGKLRLEGKDVGATINSMTGNLEYDYRYTLSCEDTKLLHRILKADDLSESDLLALVSGHFSGLLGCTHFRNYCESNQINYQFHVL